MKTNDDIESFLVRYGQPFEELGEGLWTIHDEYTNIDNIVIKHSPPVILFRVKLMELPQDNKEEFYKKLLELNVSEMLHGSYGIEKNNVVVTCTLQSENLDYNEFEAAVDSLSFVISTHYQILKEFKERRSL